MQGQIEKVKPRVGVGVFVFKDGKVLLGKRRGLMGLVTGPLRADTWNLESLLKIVPGANLLKKQD